MQSERHRNEAEWSEGTAIGSALRAELDSACEQPAYFWRRQQAQVRQRLESRSMPLRWAITAIVALSALAFALLGIKPTAPPAPTAAQMVDADDLLLQDIQHSLAQRAPEPLMPAGILVQEMTENSGSEGAREN